MRREQGTNRVVQGIPSLKRTSQHKNKKNQLKNQP